MLNNIKTEKKMEYTVKNGRWRLITIITQVRGKDIHPPPLIKWISDKKCHIWSTKFKKEAIFL